MSLSRHKVGNNLFEDASLDDIELLNMVMQGFGFRDDVQFAKYMGVDQATISNIRTGKNKMTLWLRLRLLDKLGFLNASSLVESIAPEFLAEKIRTFHYNNAQRIAEANEARQHRREGVGKTNATGKLLDYLKQTYNLDGAELTRDLQIPPNTSEKLIICKKLRLEDCLSIAEALYRKNRDQWPLTLSGITQYCTDAEQLLNKLKELSNLVFLDRLKEIASVKSDKELADFLEVSKAAISAIRRKSSNMGEPVGLKILLELEEKSPEKTFDPELLRNLIENNDALAAYITNTIKPKGAPL